MTEPETRELYWYMLAAYLFAVGFGIAAFLALVGMTNRVTVISVGAIAVILALGLTSLATFPALYRDAVHLRRSGKWNPNWWLYVGGGSLTPFVGYLGGGFVFEPSVNVFLSVLSWLGSVATMCVVYLYRRHRTVGVP